MAEGTGAELTNIFNDARKSPRLNRTRSVTGQSSHDPPASVGKPPKPAASTTPAPPARAVPSSNAQANPFSFSMSPPPPPPSQRKALRSCLSSKKEGRRFADSPMAPTSASKKTVVFGASDAVFFNKNEASHSMTPMSKRDMDQLFPQLSAPAQPGVETLEDRKAREQEVETGVTAQNSAILAQWDAEEAEVEAPESEGSSSTSSTSSTKRKREYRSPRPKRRQSLILPKGSPALLPQGPGSEEDSSEEDEDIGRGVSGRPLSGRALNDKLAQVGMEDDKDEMEEDEEEESAGKETPAEPMDVSPQVQHRPFIFGDDMPDLRQRSPSFRNLDTPTSFELGRWALREPRITAPFLPCRQFTP